MKKAFRFRIVSTLFLVGILLIGHASAQTGTCNNILIERIKASSDPDLKLVTIKTPAVLTNKYCKFHWNTLGTCCDETKLTPALPKFLDKWVGDLQRFTLKINDFSKLVKENNWFLVNRLISLYKWADDSIKKGNHRFTVDAMNVLKK